ncbi:hypothetical protein Xoosp13_269 [Xanthomonas phage Xoo-sp13]|nr:hypothetical protein Xoosp13_269 [Xanthomonas phage Xoo-sp13]
MKLLQELHSDNLLQQLERNINFLEAERNELLTYEVRIVEFGHDENTLNQILNDAERRIEAARRGMSLASKIKDPAERKLHISKMMSHLNRTRTLLDRVVKEFFPEKPGAESTGTQTGSSDEYLTPQQAAETLGVHTSKLQSLVSSGKLKMYNDGGRWALKGSEVQAMLNGGASAKPQPGSTSNRANFMQYVK